MSEFSDKINRFLSSENQLFKFIKGSRSDTISTASGEIPSLAGLYHNIGNQVVGSLTSQSQDTLTAGLGDVTLQVEAEKSFATGTWVSISSGVITMTGIVKEFTNGMLTVNVVHVVGSGTASDWSVTLSGPPGRNGRDGNGGGGGGGTGKRLVTKMPWE